MFNRCIGVYYPRKLREEKFRFRSKMLIVLAWFLAYFPFVTTTAGFYNLHGFTCKTRKCSVLNIISKEGEPQKSFKMMIGGLTVILSLLLLIWLNTAIYRKLWVSRN